jgi:hypothetical protein
MIGALAFPCGNARSWFSLEGINIAMDSPMRDANESADGETRHVETTYAGQYSGGPQS